MAQNGGAYSGGGRLFGKIPIYQYYYIILNIEILVY